MITKKDHRGEAQLRSSQEVGPQVRVQVWISRAHEQAWEQLQCNRSSGCGQRVELQLKAVPKTKESAFTEAFPQSCLSSVQGHERKGDGPMLQYR